MVFNEQKFHVKDMGYTIRPAQVGDAAQLSEVRLQIDGETENMDREKGEGFIDIAGFERLIEEDANHPRNLFLVAESQGRILGFSRCEGSHLKRSMHKVEFGVGVLKEYWGHSIGRNLLNESIGWAKSNGIKKIVLYVLEENQKAVALYEKMGFETEGILKNDKFLSDGKFHHTLIMGNLLHESGK
ncbi:GNAT family N-acetyltransferase [Planomicrobium chinense]|uniref:GNAT family N-acetyltransferase n=1 Tax=Planococcus chinensis TaxID=272917 RepID=UPI001CC3FB4D|nr:GNAT family N-acetyltransferase [Planococcus chinensis]MBZ5202350.1 GNAT family N-acetyltransferase [Planococcus chinensis]